MSQLDVSGLQTQIALLQQQLQQKDEEISRLSAGHDASQNDVMMDFAPKMQRPQPIRSTSNLKLEPGDLGRALSEPKLTRGISETSLVGSDGQSVIIRSKETGTHSQEVQMLTPTSSPGDSTQSPQSNQMDTEEKVGYSDNESKSSYVEEESDVVFMKIVSALTLVKKLQKEKIQLKEKHDGRVTNLLGEYEEKGAAIFTEFDEKQKPLNKQISRAEEPLANLLEGKFVEVFASTFKTETYQASRSGGRFGRYGGYRRQLSPDYSSARSSDSSTYDSYSRRRHRRARSVLPEPVENFYDFVTTHISDRKDERRKRSEQQRIQRAKLAAKQRIAEQKANRLEMAQNYVIPLVPYLSEEQAIRGLEQFKDDVQKFVNWIFSQDMDIVLQRLTPTRISLPSDLADSDDHADVHSPAHWMAQDDPVLEHHPSTGEPKRYVVEIIKVHEGGIVELKLICDRNRIPIDESVGSFKVPIKKLLVKSEFRLVSSAEATALDHDLEERIMRVIYQNIGGQYCPIKIEPPVRMSEYTLDFNEDLGTLQHVWHKIDGPVRYKGILSDGHSFGDVELYTQPLDGVTLNIVHIHLNDMRDEVTVDTVNITNSGLTVDDCMDFQTDMSGKLLAYKIVVKDSKVLAILSPLGDSVTKAGVVERHIPPVGSLLSIPGDHLAVLNHVPIGLICTNNPTEIEEQPSIYPKGVPCLHKHPEKLSGFVDIDIIVQNGKLLDTPIKEALPLCQVRLATESQTQQLEGLRKQAEASVSVLEEKFQGVIGELETIVNHRGSVANPRSTLDRANELRDELTALQGTLRQSGSQIYDKTRSRVTRLIRGVRALGMELRQKSLQ